MRVGIIGLGGMYRILRRALNRLDQPIAAVCDPDAGRLAEAAQACTAVSYTEHREMLDREWLDAVFVAIPPGGHTTEVADIARAKSAVFVTPPVSLDLERAVRTAVEIREAGVVNQVAFRSRYSDIALEARALVENRPLNLGFGRLLCRMSPAHPWWGKKAMSGGQLVEQSADVFDVLRLFMGEIGWVQTFAHWPDDETAEFEDSSVVNLYFKSGAVGSVVSTSVARADESYAVELCGNDVFLRLLFDHRLTGWMDGAQVDYTGEEEGYRRQVEQFLRAVQEKNQALVRSSYADSLHTLAATLAAARSLDTGAIEPVPEVKLPAPPKATTGG